MFALPPFLPDPYISLVALFKEYLPDERDSLDCQIPDDGSGESQLFSKRRREESYRVVVLAKLPHYLRLDDAVILIGPG